MKVRSSRGSSRQSDLPPATMTDQIQPTSGCRTAAEISSAAANA